MFRYKILGTSISDSGFILFYFLLNDTGLESYLFTLHRFELFASVASFTLKVMKLDVQDVLK